MSPSSSMPSSSMSSRSISTASMMISPIGISTDSMIALATGIGGCAFGAAGFFAAAGLVAEAALTVGRFFGVARFLALAFGAGRFFAGAFLAITFFALALFVARCFTGRFFAAFLPRAGFVRAFDPRVFGRFAIRISGRSRPRASIRRRSPVWTSDIVAQIPGQYTPARVTSRSVVGSGVLLKIPKSKRQSVTPSVRPLSQGGAKGGLSRGIVSAGYGEEDVTQSYDSTGLGPD